MEIEQIKPIGKKNERFYVMLSSGEKVVLHGLTLLKTKLKVGDDINKETLEEYQFEYEKLTAFDKAINLLSRGMKTKKQIMTYLKDKGYMPKVCDYVLDKLIEYKYVDDQTYASCYTKMTSKSKGKRAIAYEMKQKGVSDEIIANCLDEIADQKEVALSLAQKYIKNKPKDQKTKEKLYRHLVGKGFSHEDCFYALNKCFSEINDEDFN